MFWGEKRAAAISITALRRRKPLSEYGLRRRRENACRAAEKNPGGKIFLPRFSPSAWGEKKKKKKKKKKFFRRRNLDTEGTKNTKISLRSMRSFAASASGTESRKPHLALGVGCGERYAEGNEHLLAQPPPASIQPPHAAGVRHALGDPLQLAGREDSRGEARRGRGGADSEVRRSGSIGMKVRRDQPGFAAC